MRAERLLVVAAGMLSGCVYGSIDTGQPVDYAIACASPSATPAAARPSRDRVIAGEFVGGAATAGIVRAGYLPIVPDPRAPTFDAGTRRTVYLNRDGADLKAGYDDATHDTSSVLLSTGNMTATVPPAKFSDAEWLQYVSCVRDEFSRFNLDIVTSRPTVAGYMMQMVGGSNADLGLPQGVGGIAPIDMAGCSIIEGAVTYVFPESLGPDVKINCEAGAQEIAHAFSLQHELLAADPMTYLMYSGHKTFQDVDADCGESTPRQCICNRPQQNSVALLTQKAGLWQDAAGPEVSFNGPDDGAMLPAGPLTVGVHATHPMGVARVTLRYQDAVNFVHADCASGSIPCARSGDDYTFTIADAHGVATFVAEAADAAGDVNETHPRSVSLGAVDNPGGPITIVVAVDLSSLAASRQVRVNATVKSSAGAITGAAVAWTDRRGATTVNAMCPSGADGWTRAEQLGPAHGPRTFVVRADDAAGNHAMTSRYTLVAD